MNILIGKPSICSYPFRGFTEVSQMRWIQVGGLKGATPISYRDRHIWVRARGLRALAAVRNCSSCGSLRRDGTFSTQELEGPRNQMTKGTSSFEKRHVKMHTLCPRCGSKAYHLQKLTCDKCGYPAKWKRKYNGVPRLKDEIPLGPVKQAPKSCLLQIQAWTLLPAIHGFHPEPPVLFRQRLHGDNPWPVEKGGHRHEPSATDVGEGMPEKARTNFELGPQLHLMLTDPLQQPVSKPQGEPCAGIAQLAREPGSPNAPRLEEKRVPLNSEF
ncbi:hypothetical protein GH733_009693 [Mirounga leonina]|nr:hypothetical protein GH733_009693 [Mirounga leonina]